MVHDDDGHGLMGHVQWWMMGNEQWAMGDSDG
jgi:hypothetical protein